MALKSRLSYDTAAHFELHGRAGNELEALLVDRTIRHKASQMGWLFE
jgi:hypothetical protein